MSTETKERITLTISTQLSAGTFDRIMQQLHRDQIEFQRTELRSGDLVHTFYLFYTHHQKEIHTVAEMLGDTGKILGFIAAVRALLAPPAGAVEKKQDAPAQPVQIQRSGEPPLDVASSSEEQLKTYLNQTDRPQVKH